ncbi:MAG: flagellar biosynthesis anti-sigma factor FlgM [Gammaproteobacteria bacterium]
MANNIDTSLNSYRQINGPGDSSRTREEAASSAKGASDTSVGGSDTVEVTQSARELASLESAISSSSGVDQSRVDAIRADIAGGNYQVDGRKVADQLFRMDQALPAK